jgi:regulator of cell morphogenesis and NO signaling
LDDLLILTFNGTTLASLGTKTLQYSCTDVAMKKGGIVRHHEPERASREVAGVVPVNDHVFEVHELDSCCRQGAPRYNDRSLPEDLSAYLDRSRLDMEIHDAVALAAELPMPELVSFVLKECHRPLGARLLSLESLIKVVERSHQEEREAGEMIAWIRSAFDDLRETVLEHLLEEEDVLFPWIVSGNGDSAIKVINKVREQHKLIAVKAKTALAQAGWLVRRSETCDGQRALHASLGDFVKALAVHINVENHVLYHRAMSAWEQREGA